MLTRSMTIKLLGVAIRDVADLADALTASFGEGQLERRPSPPAASPIGFELSAVLLALSLASQGFLSDLGKDADKGLRKLIVQAAQRALPVRNNRGGFTLGIRVERPASSVLFVSIRAPGHFARLGG